MNHKPTCPINWDILPQWAQFVSIDHDGEMFCWDNKPVFTNSMHGQTWDSKGELQYLHIGTLPFVPDNFYAFENIWQRPNQ